MNQPDATRRKTTSPSTRAARPSLRAARQPRAKRVSAPPAVELPRDEQIRLRAYHFFLERNGAYGDPLTDWLRAEQELIEERRIAS